MPEDIRGLVPNKVTVVVEDYFFPSNHKTTPDELIEKIQKATRKAREQGYTDLFIDTTVVRDENGNLEDGNIELKGTRYETIEEVSRRREWWLNRRWLMYQDQQQASTYFSTDQGKADIEELREAGYKVD